MERMYMEQVPIHQIVPNPLNPRRDYSVKSDEMQEIIKERGWETGIACYKKDDHFVILSGHRRWYAATQLKEKFIPVFVVQKPKTELEELERLGSSQSGKVDWSPYEWAKYTFDLWILRERCSYRELALKMKVNERTISDRIRVFRYYPHQEIEKRLEENKVTITILSDIMEWIERLKKRQPALVQELSEDMIRSSMVQKAEKKRFTRSEVRTDKFIDFAEPEQIKTFIRDLKMKLSEAYKMVDEEEQVVGKSKYKQSLEALENAKEDISFIDSDSLQDTKKILEMLNTLERQVKMKKTEVEYFIAK